MDKSAKSLQSDCFCYKHFFLPITSSSAYRFVVMPEVKDKLNFFILYLLHIVFSISGIFRILALSINFFLFFSHLPSISYY